MRAHANRLLLVALWLICEIGASANGIPAAAILDGRPLIVQFDGPNGGAQWRADMDLAPRPHTLTVSATDPGGVYHGLTNSTFASATNSGDTLRNTFDGNGNVTQRVWTNVLGQTTRTQTLTWDAFDRLIGITDRDALGSGYNWTAIYDPQGRRLRTIDTQVITNTLVTTLNSSNSVSTVDSWYDPGVEFLEVGTLVNGELTTLTVSTYGPDASGVYGGMNGVGGLETTLKYGYYDSTEFIQDYFGNVLATISGTTVSWNPARFTSYGPVPGYQSPPLSANVALPESYGWRGHRADETGLINLGARVYDPVAGRFLSADPFGHDASMDLYSFCGGDPVNFFDPFGRLTALFYQTLGQHQFVDPMHPPGNLCVNDNTFTRALTFGAAEGIDTTVNFGAGLLTPQVDMTPQQQQLFAELTTISPMKNWFGINYGPSYWADNVSQLGPPTMNSISAYGVGVRTAESPNTEVQPPDYSVNRPPATTCSTALLLHQ